MVSSPRRTCAKASTGSQAATRATASASKPPSSSLEQQLGPLAPPSHKSTSRRGKNRRRGKPRMGEESSYADALARQAPPPQQQRPAPARHHRQNHQQRRHNNKNKHLPERRQQAPTQRKPPPPVASTTKKENSYNHNSNHNGGLDRRPTTQVGQARRTTAKASRSGNESTASTGRQASPPRHDSSCSTSQPSCSSLLEDVPDDASQAAVVDDEALRHQAVACLTQVAQGWWRRRYHLPESNPPAITIVPFGSWRLGVHRPGTADLDLLVVWSGPSSPDGNSHWPTTRALLDSWIDVLQQQACRFSHLQALPAAYTPVLKCVFDGRLPLDLLFCGLARPNKLLAYHNRITTTHQQQQPEPSAVLQQPVYYHLDDSDLAGLVDPMSVRSLNGVRVCQYLLEATTAEGQGELYRRVLRAVKEWALEQGLYSNVIGLLGGINWAILVAYVLQHSSPNNTTTVDSLLESFFFTFAHWEWPKPVMLTASLQETPPTLNDRDANGDAIPLFPAWNPAKEPRDAHHLMPILTPVYPTMNSSYNVGVPQLRRLQQELLRTHQRLVEFHERQERHSSYDHNNDDDGSSRATYLCNLLLQPADFFQQHEHFVQVVVSGSNDIAWFSFVERCLRSLVVDLETPEVQSWPLARFYHRRWSTAIDNSDGRPHSVATTVSASSPPPNEEEDVMTHRQESHFFIGLRIVTTSTDTAVDSLQYLTSPFLHTVHTWPDRTRPDRQKVTAFHVTAIELPDFVLLDDTHDDCLDRSKASSNSAQNRNEAAASTKDSTRVEHMVSNCAPSSPSKRCRRITGALL